MPPLKVWAESEKQQDKTLALWLYFALGSFLIGTYSLTDY